MHGMDGCSYSLKLVRQKISERLGGADLRAYKPLIKKVAMAVIHGLPP